MSDEERLNFIVIILNFLYIMWKLKKIEEKINKK